jgi:hypothetical protein
MRVTLRESDEKKRNIQNGGNFNYNYNEKRINFFLIFIKTIN